MPSYIPAPVRKEILELYDQGVGPMSIAVRLNLQAYHVRVILSQKPHPLTNEPIMPFVAHYTAEEYITKGRI